MPGPAGSSSARLARRGSYAITVARDSQDPAFAWNGHELALADASARAGPFVVVVDGRELTIGDVYAVHPAATPINGDEATAASQCQLKLAPAWRFNLAPLGGRVLRAWASR